MKINKKYFKTREKCRLMGHVFICPNSCLSRAGKRCLCLVINYCVNLSGSSVPYTINEVWPDPGPQDSFPWMADTSHFPKFRVLRVPPPALPPEILWRVMLGTDSWSLWMQSTYRSATDSSQIKVQPLWFIFQEEKSDFSEGETGNQPDC